MAPILLPATGPRRDHGTLWMHAPAPFRHRPAPGIHHRRTQADPRPMGAKVLNGKGIIGVADQANGTPQALLFQLMEKVVSLQGERESRSDRDDNRGWRRCRCSSPPSRRKAQRETA